MALHWAEPCRVLASHGSQRCRYRPLEGLTRRVRSGAESLLLLTRQDGPQAAPRPVLCPASYRQRRANRTNERPPSSSLVGCFVDFPEPAELIGVFLMPQTEVAAPAFPPVSVLRFTRAAIRFIASFAALIGISLLLASL